MWMDKVMICDHEGMVWITSASGTWCFNPATKRFVDVSSEIGILRDKVSLTLVETKDHNILIGTENGVYVYDRKKHTIYPLPGGEAIEDIRIAGLLCDAHGDISFARSFPYIKY